MNKPNHAMKRILAGTIAFGLALAAQATDFTWQSTAGGDLADGANWNQSGTAPGAATSDKIIVKKDQSAPITLSMSLDMSAQYNHEFGFNGELKFDTKDTELKMGRFFFRSANKTTFFTRGLWTVGACYFEENANGCHDNTFVVDGADATAAFSSTMIGSKFRNNTMVVTNGAMLTGASVSVGRDAFTYTQGYVASNNLFRVTGSGTTVTLTDTLSTGIRQDNRIEIDDHAVVTAKAVKLGVSSYDNADQTAGDVRHLYDSGKRLRIANGAKLIVNPDGVIANGHPRLTVGWHTGSNVLEVADGGELICYTNRVVIGNYSSDAEGTQTMIDYDPNYRFTGNRLRVTGKDSKVRIYAGGSGNPGVMLAPGVYMNDQRIEILDGASWYSSGEFWTSSGCDNGIYLGKGARFEHEIYGVQIGVNATATNHFFTVDGGIYAPKSATTVGQAGVGTHFDIINGGLAALTNTTIYVGSTNGGKHNVFTVGKDGLLLASNVVLYVSNGNGTSNNTFAVRDGGRAIFTGKADHSTHHVITTYPQGGAGTVLVEGSGSLLDMSDDQLDGVKSDGSKNASMIVRDGGTLKFWASHWGDQGTSTNGSSIAVSNGTLRVGNWLDLGGSDGVNPHGCWMEVAGAESDIQMTGGMTVANDSMLSFAVPKDGFNSTPIKVNSLSFGTKCAVRPTIRVTMDPKNQVRYATLVEAANKITVPDDLTLELPTGAKLLKAGDAQYDEKKLIVKLPREVGLMVIVR